MRSISLVTILLFNTSIAQEPPRPEFMDQPYAYDRDSGVVVQLERCKLEVKAKLASAGYVVSETPSSPVQAPDGKKTTFLIATGEPLLPSSMRLYKLDVGRGRRTLDLKPLKGENLAPKEMPCNVRKLSADLYEIVPISALAPGEYAFFAVGVAYAFKAE